MESKVPFIAEYDPYSVTRPFKRHRPISTRPWTLSFFLAATGICFGLLLAISLIEKDPLPNTKRDLQDVYQRHALVDRQDSAAATTKTVLTSIDGAYLSVVDDAAAASTTIIDVAAASTTTIYVEASASASQCTNYVTLTYTECWAPPGYVCPTTTDAPAAAATTTGSCVTSTEAETMTITGSLLAITSQCTEYVTATATTCISSSGYVCPAVTTSPPAAAATTGSCYAVTSTVTLSVYGSYLSVTSQCTPVVVTGAVTICTAPSGYYCPDPLTTTNLPPAATTGDCSTMTTYMTEYTTGSLLSITSQSTTLASAMASSPLSVISQTPTLTSSMGSALLSIISPTPTPAIYPASQTAPASESSQPTTMLTSESALLSVVSQTAAISTSSTFVGATPSQYMLSVTAQGSTVSYGSSAVTSGVFPLANPIATTLSSTSISTDILMVYTLTFEDLTETLSLYTDESTTVTAIDGTYIVAVSSDSIQTSLYSTSSSVSLLNQGGSFTRTDAPSIPASITATLSLTTTTTSATSTTSQALNPGLKKDLVLVKLSTFHPYYYFLAVYLPKILAVIMAVLWGVVFGALKLMEPFYQLSAPTGAFASDTMFGHYLASEWTLLSLSATIRGRWVMLLGGAVTIVWAAVVALVSESMGVIATGRCRNGNGPEYRCDPAWVVSPKIIMVLLVLTGLAFVLTMILMLMMSQRKRTGCFHDPSSIASMVELLGNPQVMKDLRAIKPSSSDREVKLLLGDNRYKIGLYDPASGKEAHEFQHDQSRWGLIKLEEAPINRKIARKTSASYSAVLNPTMVVAEEEKANRKRRIFQLIYDLTMLLFALGVFGVVLAYYLDSKPDPFNNFFNSTVFGPQFILSCLSLVLAIGWRRMSQEMTLMAPYRSMARAYQAHSGVMANRSILARPARSPWTALYRGLQLRYYMVTIAAVCAVLADILLIAVSGVPYNTGQTLLGLRISSFTSLGILGIMILTAIAVLIYNRTTAGGARKLPRSPDTLLGVWLYLCQSSLVPSPQNSSSEDFSSPLDDAELKRKYQHYQCGFDRKTSTDGVRWWTIDSIYGLLHSDPAPAMQPPYTQHQNHIPQPDNNTHQTRPQPYEASATPIDNPYGYFPPQHAPSQRAAAAPALRPDTTYNIALPGPPSQRRRPHPSQSIPFEAQGKSPVSQIPPALSGFEQVRPQRHQILRVTPTPQGPIESRSRSEEDETAMTPQEALIQYEYEQKFYGGNGGTGRRAGLYSQGTQGRGNGNGRWTNDGKSRFRYD